MKRYRPIGKPGEAQAVEDENGDFVLFLDVQGELNYHQEQVKDLKKQVQFWHGQALNELDNSSWAMSGHHSEFHQRKQFEEQLKAPKGGRLFALVVVLCWFIALFMTALGFQTNEGFVQVSIKVTAALVVNFSIFYYYPGVKKTDE